MDRNPFDVFDEPRPTRPTPVPTAAMPRANPFDRFDTPAAPAQATGIDWSKFNRGFGELKKADPSFSEYVKSKGQDALMALGANPYNARKLSEGLVGVGNLNPAMGAVLSAGDLSHDLSRGNYGHAALDTLGMVPAGLAAKRYVQGVPKVPMADVPRGKPDTSFLPERGAPDPHGQGPYGLRGPQPQVLPNDELKTAATSAYRDTRYSPLEYHPNAMNDFVARSKQGLEHPELGFSPEVAQGTHNMMDRWVAQMSHRNTPITAQDWDTFRQQLRKLEGPDGAAGGHVAGWIDQYMVNPPPGALIRGTQADLDQLDRTFDVARGNYRSYKTAETVEKEIDRAGTRAGSKNSGRNTGNMTRDKLGALTQTDAGEAKIFGARPEERAAIDAVVEGDRLTNSTRDWSNRLGGGGGAGQSVIGGMATAGGTAVGHAMGMDPYTAMAFGLGSGVATGKAGGALRTFSNERTVKAADDVVDLIRRNSPEYAARVRAAPDIPDPAAMTRDAITYALIPQIKQQGGNVWDQAHAPYELPPTTVEQP